ncbi:MAG: MFS transporter [Rhodospirillaceae bacterium]|jgi:MFS family permease|nr:MFS transporter [Rhodospirillaceae bacterium]MBT3492209.1 MFS transporter [Rhodospirillaceae bacterium]MBT3778540.1 MFS transporter [Rhodospirillaceae bacterium]MBT3977554.1 MFS transporter [Rhodospirillaceae bacterium]MBT4563868.1 MFS transporter [Rhodospirillaceae bacterium]
MQSAMRDQEDSRYGWVMVFVGFTLMAMSFGALGAVGVFLKPIAADYGWSRGSIALGYTTAALSAAAFGILWGFMADGRPTRRFMFMGVLAVALATLLLSQTSSRWQFYLFYFLFGAFGHGALMSTIWANVGQWFVRNKGLALGIGMAGGAFGQGAVPFVARLLISAYGWQSAYLILGLGFLGLGLAVAALTRDPPAKLAHLAELKAAGAKSGNGWSLGEAAYVVSWFSMAVIFCCSCMSVVIVHLVPMLTDGGLEPQVAASVLTTMMLMGALGRMITGRICDLIGSVRTYALASLGQTVLVIWFPHIDNLFVLYLLAVVFGALFSGVMASMVISVNMEVPGKVAARSWSIVSFFAWIGMGTGSYMGGVIFDLTGGYTWAFAFAAGMGCLNLLILICFRISRGRRRPELTPA